MTDLLSALAGLTLTERVCVSPARMDEEPVILIFFTFTPLTVTSHWAVLPLEAMAVIIALPGATAVTLPLELTVATLALEDFQIISLFEGFFRRKRRLEREGFALGNSGGLFAEGYGGYTLTLFHDGYA